MDVVGVGPVAAGGLPGPVSTSNIQESRPRQRDAVEQWDKA